jgi:hypothetical protein
VKIGPQLTQWRLDPAPGPHHVMWATLAGTSGLREPSSLTWKSGIAEMVQSARAARKCNGQAKPASKAARISAVEGGGKPLEGYSGPLLKSVQRSPLPFGDDNPRSQPRIVPLKWSPLRLRPRKLAARWLRVRSSRAGMGRHSLRLQGTARRPVNRFSE